MTLWMDTIGKLRSFGYSVTLDGGKLRYTYHGKGDPLSNEITPLLEILKIHKAEILQEPNFLIEQTLLEINQTYPELRDRLIDPPKWKALSEIEQEINQAALEDDFEGLERALGAYKQAVLGVEHGEAQGSLFQGLTDKQDRPGSDKSTMLYVRGSQR